MNRMPAPKFKRLKKAYDAIMGGRAVHTGQMAAWGKRSSATTPPPKAKPKVGRPTPATSSSGAARSGTPSPGQPSSGWRHEEPRRGPDGRGSAPQMNPMPDTKDAKRARLHAAEAHLPASLPQMQPAPAVQQQTRADAGADTISVVDSMDGGKPLDADDSDSMAEGQPIEPANWDADDDDSMAGGEPIESPPAVPPGHGRTGGGKPNGPCWKKHRAILLAEDGYHPVFLGRHCLADIVVPGAHVFDVGVTEADLSDHMTIIQAKDLDVDRLPESLAQHLREVRSVRTTWPPAKPELVSALREALLFWMPDARHLR